MHFCLTMIMILLVDVQVNLTTMQLIRYISITITAEYVVFGIVEERDLGFAVVQDLGCRDKLCGRVGL